MANDIYQTNEETNFSHLILFRFIGKRSMCQKIPQEYVIKKWFV